MSTEVTGNGGDATSSGGAATTSTGGRGARTSRGGAPTGGSSAQSTMVSFGGGGQSSMPASCPTFADDFLPQINPVCAKCHLGGGRTPDWSNYSEVKANCSIIGSRVASGLMPPRSSGTTLTSAQKALVADFVRLGCPQTKSDLPSTCP